MDPGRLYRRPGEAQAGLDPLGGAPWEATRTRVAPRWEALAALRERTASALGG